MCFKVLFIYPNFRSETLVPPGVTLLSRILKNHGFGVDLFDTTDYGLGLAKDYDKLTEESLGVRPSEHRKLKCVGRDVWLDLNEKVRSFNPDLIAMSCTESTFLLGIEVIKRLEDQDIPVILGGIFATSAPDRALSFFEIDMVCVGEGEVTLLELCKRMEAGCSYKNVPGLWFRQTDGSICRNHPAPLVDLDQNPTDFDLELFDLDRLVRPMQGQLYRMAPVETARGCPYHCTFCNSPGQPLRKKSMLKVQEELLFYKRKFGVEYMFFWADTFLAMSNWEFDQFCEMYQDIDLPFWIQTRVETVTEVRLCRLRDLGLQKVAFGIENGNEEFRRRAMKKKFTNEEAVRRLRTVSDLGITYNTNNIVGYPHETREIAMDTVRLNSRFVGADTVNCFTFAPYYGTEARVEAVRSGFMGEDVIAPGNAEDSILEMPLFSKEAIRGVRRCFALYTKFPELRWEEIRRAETDDDLFHRLQSEYRDTFF